MPLVIRLAWRFIRGQQRQGLVSLIAGISVAGLALAIAVLIVVLSVMQGFEREFSQRILGVAPHARLYFAAPRSDWSDLQQQLQRDPAILEVLPFTEFEALAIARGRAYPIGVQGIDSERGLARLSPYIEWAGASSGQTSNTGDTKLAARQLIIGADLAKKLDLQAGDSIRLVRVEAGSERSAGLSASTRTRLYSLEIAGLLRTGTQLDAQVGLVDLAFANQVRGLDEHAQGLQLWVENVFDVNAEVRAAIDGVDLDGYLSSWKSDYGNLYAAIQLSRQLVVMLVATIVAVAVFNVFVTLGMVVRHKQAEIAILRTLGLSRPRLLIVFVCQGVMIALPGCLIGAVVGVILSNLLPGSVAGLQAMLDIELLDTAIYPINYLPADTRWQDVTAIVITALGMSFIATLLPAFQASRLQPAAVLRRG